MPTINYLTASVVRVLHAEAISADFKGSFGLKHLQNPAGLESAVARPRQRVFGRPAHKGVPRKAAVLFHALIANHPFFDGNKRAAVMALQFFLIANGRVPLLTNDELIELALEVADRQGTPHGELVDRLTRQLSTLSVPISHVLPKLSNQRFISEYRDMGRRIRKMLASDDASLLELAHRLALERAGFR